MTQKSGAISLSKDGIYSEEQKNLTKGTACIFRGHKKSPNIFEQLTAALRSRLLPSLDAAKIRQFFERANYFARKFAYMSFINYLCAMNKIREVIVYKSYFDDFFSKQPQNIKDKIIKVLDIIEHIERVPVTYLKYLEGTNGLFEIRSQLGSNIFRIFCFFDGGKLVVLLTGFQKKTQKTPKVEIERAERLMKEYYKEKEKEK